MIILQKYFSKNRVKLYFPTYVYYLLIIKYISIEYINIYIDTNVVFKKIGNWPSAEKEASKI